MHSDSAFDIVCALNLLGSIAVEISKSKGFLQPGELNAIPEIHIGLIHSEVSEALEAMRQPEMPMSEKISGFTLLEEELADIVIRVAIIAQMTDSRLGLATVAKSDYNETRPHKHGGKRF